MVGLPIIPAGKSSLIPIRSMEDALARWQGTYRRDLWINQPDYVEIWVEKDALAGVISPITTEYDVALYVCRGYSSTTFLYEAATYLIRPRETGLHLPFWRLGSFRCGCCL